MVITLKNIGVVKQAKVDLDKRLILLCGPNNSGKTYVAYSVYGLLSAMREQNYNDNHAEELIEFLGDSIDKDNWEVDLLRFVQGNNYRLLINFVDKFAKKLGDVFDDKSNFTLAQLELHKVDPDKLQIMIEGQLIDSRFRLTANTILHFEKPVGSVVLKFWTESKGAEDKENLQVSRLVSYIVPSIVLRALCNDSFIAPTQRTSVNIFRDELSLRRIKQIEQLALDIEKDNEKEVYSILKKTKRYTLPIRDSLVIAEDLNSLKKDISEFAFLADELETSILNGKIDVSKEGELQYAPTGYKGVKISVNLAGSMVNSLSGLVFYFRHLADKGDFIILDEPELNLHPDNQIKIARFISAVINNGFSVMISTHSDYIIHEFNNLILLNSVDQDKFPALSKKWGYKDGHKLDHKDVEVLLFSNANNKGVTTESLEVGKDGFAVEAIDKCINQLNQSSADIFLSLNEPS